MNVCTLVGRLATDPDMRYTQSGTPVARFRLAVDSPPRGETQERSTDFLTVVAFGRQAEIVGQFLDKGSQVAVVGRVSARQWETQDGQRRESVEIIAQRVEFLETRAQAERRRAQAPAADAAAGGDEPPPPDDLGPADDDIFGDL